MIALINDYVFFHISNAQTHIALGIPNRLWIDAHGGKVEQKQPSLSRCDQLPTAVLLLERQFYRFIVIDIMHDH
ncbi:hypothetical protein DERP_001335 [Dermatophagoides pteronyssinus]|uniref:Uncharacterized protein n=1 Tax=Dermatophagoides pteronyssinus TaxID=6956 RepID=A0ABQ8JE60_DERPT|nr:hypothetical protein DERP_001335 [Dermatophagoides pteronyssinus]